MGLIKIAASNHTNCFPENQSHTHGLMGQANFPQNLIITASD